MHLKFFSYSLVANHRLVEIARRKSDGSFTILFSHLR